MRTQQIAFVCAVACVIAIPLIVNALAARLGKTLSDERRIQALLYCCINAALLVTIFYLWLVGGKEP